MLDAVPHNDPLARRPPLDQHTREANRGTRSSGSTRDQWRRMERRPSKCSSPLQPSPGLSTFSSPLSARAESFDFRGYPPLSECEEIISHRWLPSGLRLSASTFSTKQSERRREGYVPLCGHGEVCDRRIFPSRNPSDVKCRFFLPAGGLLVREDKDQIWVCTSRIKHADRSWHAVQLVEGYYLDIRGVVDITTLQPCTEYAVYLLFKFTGESFGFSFQEASIEIGAKTSRQCICLRPGSGVAENMSYEAKMPNEPVNGWQSIEMGRFFTCSSMGEGVRLFISLTEGRKMDPSRRAAGNHKYGTVPDMKGIILGGVVIEPTLTEHAKRFMCSVLTLTLSWCTS